MKTTDLARHLAAVAVATLAGTAAAAPETFYGYDAGLGNSQRLPSHPLSDSARAAFLARLAEGVPTETFESVAVTEPVLAPRTLTLSFGVQSAVLSGPGLVMDSPAPSTANPVNGIPSGVYPTSGTRAWLSSDDFELRCAQEQVALGFYGVDIGDFNGQLVLDLVHADLSVTRVPASSGTLDIGGAVQFFGVLSVDRPFVSVRFGNTAPAGYDGFVFDDLTIGTAAQLAPVPEPSTLATWLTGLAVAGAMARRRRPRAL